ncbi:MAG: hypothetical protein ACYDBP_04365 [Leptospirales bacterium]
MTKRMAAILILVLPLLAAAPVVPPAPERPAGQLPIDSVMDNVIEVIRHPGPYVRRVEPYWREAVDMARQFFSGVAPTVGRMIRETPAPLVFPAGPSVDKNAAPAPGTEKNKGVSR